MIVLLSDLWAIAGISSCNSEPQRALQREGDRAFEWKEMVFKDLSICRPMGLMLICFEPV